MDNMLTQKHFLSLLEQALNQVDKTYYGIEWWEHSKLNYPELYKGHPKQKALRKYLARYDERVFCYELYHQIRSLMEKNELFSHIRLQGELNKLQIHDLEQVFHVTSLDKKYIPDFLLHSPGDFGEQEIVIEVKSEPNISFTNIRKDFEKLEKFISSYHYRMGIFLVINNSENRLRKLLSDNKQWIMNNLCNRTSIIFISKESRGTVPLICKLDEV